MSSIEHLISLAAVPAKSIPASARRYATLSLFDWIMCGRAGAQQDLSKVIRTYILEDAGRKSATVFGSKSKVPSRAAALVNGTISHALDYDDTHFAHIGHTFVMPICLVLKLPAALVWFWDVGIIKKAFIKRQQLAHLGQLLPREDFIDSMKSRCVPH